MMRKILAAVLMLVIAAAILVVFLPEQTASLFYGAPTTVTLKDAKNVELELIYTGEKPKGVGSVQSMAITDDYFVIAGRPKASEKDNQLIVINRKTLTDVTSSLIEESMTYELGHANGMTYNPQTNELVVVGIRNSANKYELAARISLEDFELVGTDKMACYGNGIAYDTTHDEYIVRSGESIYTLNDIPGMKQDEVSVETEFTGQDIAYHNGYVYLANWIESGSNLAAMRYALVSNQNVIYKVDKRGNIVDIFLLKTPKLELEGIDFVGDEAYVLYNGLGKEKNEFRIYKLKLSADEL